MSNFETRLSGLKSRIPNHVKVVAVSKTKPISDIQAAYDAGQRVFGENKVQEILSKHADLPGDIEWHLIGHLQSNKVKQIVPVVSMIESVDSVKLLNKIQNQAESLDKKIDCLLQVHIAKEESKFGFDSKELRDFLQKTDLTKYQNIVFSGLMGMATFTDNMEQVAGEFDFLRLLFNDLKDSVFSGYPEFKELSMGMTGDYETAIASGSTMIRVGTLLFGSR